MFYKSYKFLLIEVNNFLYPTWFYY